MDELNVDGLRRILFPNIMFFDEVIAELSKVEYDIEFSKKAESYEDHLTKTVQDCVFYFVEKLLGVENETGKQN